MFFKVISFLREDRNGGREGGEGEGGRKGERGRGGGGGREGREGEGKVEQYASDCMIMSFTTAVILLHM